MLRSTSTTDILERLRAAGSASNIVGMASQFRHPPRQTRSKLRKLKWSAGCTNSTAGGGLGLEVSYSE